MDRQHALGFPLGEAFGSAFGQAALEFGQRCSGQRKADGKGMTTEAREEVGAGFDGVEQLKSVDGSARTVGNAVFNADDERRFGGAFDNARSEDADDAAMPAVAIDNDEARRSQFLIGGEARFNRRDCALPPCRGGRDSGAPVCWRARWRGLHRACRRAR